MNDRLIDLTVHIRRPPSEVFAAWSTAKALAAWFAPMAVRRPDIEMDFSVGGHYSIEMHMPDGSVHTTRGVIREIVEDEKIVMTWHCDAFEDPETVVEVHFQPSGDGTDIHLLHRTFDTSQTCDAHRGGWQACLGELARQLQ